MSAAAPPTLSVLIGRASVQDERRILETLASLRAQRGAPSFEVIVADRRDDALTREIEAAYPEVRVLRRPPATPLPELRAAALAEARGRYVVVTEDHCVAPPDWLFAMARAFADAPGAAAVGGCVENGVADTALDHATFLCEYGHFLSPVPEGPAPDLPGMNIAYERAALGAVDPLHLRSGFWETTVHPVLRAAGRGLHSTNAIRLTHAKRFGFLGFARQRYLYSRYYAGQRFGAGARARRLAACVASLALPAILLARIARVVRAKGRNDAHLAAALPWLGVFVIIWAWGEMVGYAFGAGGSLAEIE